MTILALPNITRVPASIKFSLRPNTASFTSTMNGAMQTTELPGARWYATLNYNNVNGDEVRALKAWVNKLSGMAGRFYLYDFSHPTPSGTAAGTPLVSGASQTGRTLITDGWTANQTALFKSGDYFGVNGQLCVITETIASDGSGNSTLKFEAPLRTSPVDNAVITTVRPTCTMMLTDDKQDSFEFELKTFASVTLECMEMF
jgi:hypothetical protein